MNRTAIFRALLVVLLALPLAAFAQNDWIRTGTGVGVNMPRIAVTDFKASTADTATPPLQKVFNDTLFNDLQHSGILDVISKSLYPLQQPGSPQDLDLTCGSAAAPPSNTRPSAAVLAPSTQSQGPTCLSAWGNDPTRAGMLAFGNIGVVNGNVVVYGWLYDVTSPQSPQVLGKQYTEKATSDNARDIAHQFANDIVFRLGGGIQGIFETKIYYVHAAGKAGNKEIWVMDYDGNNPHQLTHLGTISLSPRPSPDNTRVAFSSLTGSGWQIRMYSLDLGRLVAFPHFPGTNISPAWSPDMHLAFSSSRTGDPEIYVCNQDGGELRRVTAYHGPDVSPTWNPKTGAEIAWVTGRSGLPQIYEMESDGTNPQPLTTEGYAVSPSWSPNGMFLTFAWTRHYGPGAPGGQDIYVFDIASKRFIQLTHDAGRNDFPSWSPDGRHIVFQSDRSGTWQLWSMLADGSDVVQLTHGGENTQPAWSWK